MLKSAAPNKSCALIKRPFPLGSVKGSSKAFGLKSSSFRVFAMPGYKAKLIGPNDKEKEFEAPDDAYNLGSAEACSACAGRMGSGMVDQSDGPFLDDKQMEEGYVQTCVSYMTSDCVIHTHMDGDLF